MKRTYIKPQAQTMSLFTEDKLLAGSTFSFEVDSSKESDVVMSEEKGWSSESWNATDED